jgi:hypothetical protein
MRKASPAKDRSNASYCRSKVSGRVCSLLPEWREARRVKT